MGERESRGAKRRIEPGSGPHTVSTRALRPPVATRPPAPPRNLGRTECGLFQDKELTLGSSRSDTGRTCDPTTQIWWSRHAHSRSRHAYPNAS
eukprot:2994918-Rhodomonas_salina.1